MIKEVVIDGVTYVPKNETRDKKCDSELFNSLGQPIIDTAYCRSDVRNIKESNWGSFEDDYQASDFDMYLSAVKKIWDWAKVNDDYKPNWKDDEEDDTEHGYKYHLSYDHDSESFKVLSDYSYQGQFLLPYFSSEEKAYKCIYECRESLAAIKLVYDRWCK